MSAYVIQSIETISLLKQLQNQTQYNFFTIDIEQQLNRFWSKQLMRFRVDTMFLNQYKNNNTSSTKLWTKGYQIPAKILIRQNYKITIQTDQLYDIGEYKYSGYYHLVFQQYNSTALVITISQFTIVCETIQLQ
ncbi:Hypothetical_protein [Hexamita inflata]|uniref:Hypothetical_protein n=1 Tax=Hexamita inflata TaxID=28002 RepID=A0AA86UWZ9_9EUKA|nr:Hypothetical protein HINF_LOCUS55531 [Hexamita inflata]